MLRAVGKLADYAGLGLHAVPEVVLHPSAAQGRPAAEGRPRACAGQLV